MELSLVIPCYNEEKNLPLLISRCAPLSEIENIEVLFVNNGSSDGSSQVFSDLLAPYSNFHCISIDINEGYGNGILVGLSHAKGRVLSWTHADMQCDPLDVMFGYKYFEGRDDNIFVKGLRYGRPAADVFFSFCMSIFETILLRTKLWDINAQPTMFSRSLFESLNHPPTDFSLDLFVYYQAKFTNATVYKFPVHFGERAFGSSSWNMDWRSKLKFINRTIKFSLKLRKRI